MARAPHTLSRIAAPAGVCGALALAVGVWLIPSGVLDPRQPAPAVPKPVPGIQPPKIEPPPMVEHDWTTLIQKLDMIREPITTEVVADDPGTNSGDPGVATPIPPPMSLNWQYEGYVAEGDRITALVRIASVQRFVFIDQEITDPSIPGYGKATIKSITPEEIVVLVGETEVRVQRAQQVQTNELIHAQPATAGRVE